MRILHTSDWHLGRSLEHISRIDEQSSFIDCLVNLADEKEIDIVLIAGDIYDTYNPSAAAEELFYEAMDRLGGKGKRAVIVIAGNHDNPDRLCASSPLAYKNGIILLGYPGSDAGMYKTDEAGINIVDSGPGWLELSMPGHDSNAVIIAMPYPSESRLEELLTDKADEGELQKAYSERIGSIFSELSGKFREDTVNLIISHLFILGGSTSDSERTLQVGGAMTVDPAVLPEKAHYVALGHLHRPQQIRSAACPAYYAGSPLAYSFSEADYSKAVFIVDAVPGEKAEIETVYLDCGRPLKKWFAQEGIGQAIKWCEEGKDPNAWVDLEILTDRVLTVDEQKMLRSLHPGIINIRPRLKTEEMEVISPVSREGRKIDELFRDYYRYRMGVDIPDELMEAFIDIINVGHDDNDQEDDGGQVSGLEDDGGQVSGLEDVGGQVSGLEDVGGQVSGLEDVGGQVSGLEDVGSQANEREDIGGSEIWRSDSISGTTGAWKNDNMSGPDIRSDNGPDDESGSGIAGIQEGEVETDET